MIECCILTLYVSDGLSAYCMLTLYVFDGLSAYCMLTLYVFDGPDPRTGQSNIKALQV